MVINLVDIQKEDASPFECYTNNDHNKSFGLSQIKKQTLQSSPKRICHKYRHHQFFIDL